MSLSADKVADLRIAHLGMIQGVVSRLSSSSAAAKNYSLTVAVALVGASFTTEMPILQNVAALSVALFAFIDANYLYLERRFRKLYSNVSAEEITVATDFRMKVENFSLISYVRTLFSWSILIFYGSLGSGLGYLLLARQEID